MEPYEKHPVENVFYTGESIDSILYHGELIKVDEEIVDLVKLMWKKNLRTLFSCQGSPSEILDSKGKEFLAYIMLMQDKTSMSFIRYLLADYPPFKNRNSTLWEINFDCYPSWGGNRIIIHFPYFEIPQLEKFVSDFNS